MTSKNELTDEKIGTLIDQKTADAISWYSSRLSKERQKVLEYVERKLPAPYSANGSRWVNPAVFTALEYMRAQIGDTFSAGSGIVQFSANNSEDIEAARIASEYANHVFYRQNDGEQIIRDAIFDGLTSRVGVAKVWWENDPKEEPLEFDGVSQDELQLWLDDDAITELEVSDQGDGTFAGRLVRVTDDGRVRVQVINPEEFAVERNAERLDEKTFCVHYTRTTMADLLKDHPHLKGKEDDLRAAQGDDFALSPEVLARHEATSDGLYRHSTEIQDDLQTLMVIEAYTRLRRKGDLTARLYKVLRCGKVNIAIDPVEELPFVVFTPIPRPHVFYGENYCKSIVPTQDILTAAQRSIIDSAMLTNNPRWMVAKNGLTNPKELLDNRLGGIVNVKDMASIAPLHQPQMNPIVFSLVQGMEQLSESITGISAASIGLNKDVLSKQNSAGLVEQQTGASQTRQKEIARNFAQQFLIPLFEKINRLVVQFEKNERQVEVAGNFVPVTPWMWQDSRRAAASVHLGYGEKEAKARKRLEFLSAMKQQGGDVFLGYEGAYALLADALTDEGERTNIPRYLPITPDKIQPPQPDPKVMAEVAKIQAEAQAILLNAQTAAKKVDNHAELEVLKQQLKAMQEDFQQLKSSNEERRKDAEVASRIDVAQREMHLLENPPVETESRGIISP